MPEPLSAIDATRIVTDEIDHALGRLDPAQLEAMTAAMLDSQRLFVTGEGRSGFMARAFAMRLVHLGRPVHVVGETTTPALGAGDRLVAISGSGSTASTLMVAERTIKLGGDVFAVTNNDEAALASLATGSLVIPGATKDQSSAEKGSVQLLSSLFDQVTHVALDIVCLLMARRLSISEASAKGAHATTE